MRLVRVGITMVILLAFMLGGCASSEPSLTSGYVLESVNGTEPTVADVRVNLVDGNLYGSGPVNQWSAGLSENKVGPIIITRRGGPAHEMAFESKIVLALEGAVYEERGDQLVFTKGDDRVVFTAIAN